MGAKAGQAEPPRRHSPARSPFAPSGQSSNGGGVSSPQKASGPFGDPLAARKSKSRRTSGFWIMPAGFTPAEQIRSERSKTRFLTSSQGGSIGPMLPPCIVLAAHLPPRRLRPAIMLAVSPAQETASSTAQKEMFPLSSPVAGARPTVGPGAAVPPLWPSCRCRT